MEALLGVVVGFVLKAIFDLMTEGRRWKREDHLRFINQKMTTYAEFAGIALRAGLLAEKVREVRGMHDKNLDTLRDLQEGEPDPQRLKQLRKKIADIDKTLSVVEAQYENVNIELSRVMGVIQIIASDEVEEAAIKVVMSAPAAIPIADFHAAQRRFQQAAARDLALPQPQGETKSVSKRRNP